MKNNMEYYNIFLVTYKEKVLTILYLYGCKRQIYANDINGIILRYRINMVRIV